MQSFITEIFFIFFDIVELVFQQVDTPFDTHIRFITERVDKQMVMNQIFCLLFKRFIFDILKDTRAISSFGLNGFDT